MKQFISILILALFFTSAINTFAQDSKDTHDQARKEKWEKFRQDKHEFYIKTMELTANQAQQFLPLFDEMEKKKFEATREVRREARAIEKGENITDEQYKAAADRAAALPEKEVMIEKEYYEQFCKILTPRQQFLYHRCAPEFQKKMVGKKHNKAAKNNKDAK